MHIKLGDRFGRMLVIGRGNRSHDYRILCRCDCGNEKYVYSNNLTHERTRSCGCLQADTNLVHSLKHGHTINGKFSPEYRAWSCMKNRCADPGNTCFKYYGGRGIEVCEEWENSFESFLADIGLKPSPGCTLERIDNNKGYEPGNVRWATRKEQNRNKRNNKSLTVNGITKLICQWAEIRNMNYFTIVSRKFRGWSDEDAVNKPLDNRGIYGKS